MWNRSEIGVDFWEFAGLLILIVTFIVLFKSIGMNYKGEGHISVESIVFGVTVMQSDVSDDG